MDIGLFGGLFIGALWIAYKVYMNRTWAEKGMKERGEIPWSEEDKRHKHIYGEWPK
jgi:hypothetical protein